jgi:hypothetical protein
MKKSLTVCFMILISFLSCKKEILNECGGKDPVKNLEWLNTIVKNNTGRCITVWRSKLNGTTVFGVAICPCCFAGGPTTLYRCDGSLYCKNLSNKECQEDLIEAGDKAENIYQGE